MDWHGFFRIPPDLTLWQIIDSQFWTTVLAAAFGALLLRYERQLREAQEDARAAEEALQTRVEVDRKENEQDELVEPVGPQNGQGGNRRVEAKQIVDEARAYLDEQAAEDSDGRHQRTYGKISGHYPSDLALALRERRRITDQQFEAAFALFSKWKKYARGRAANNSVSAEELLEFRRLGELTKGHRVDAGAQAPVTKAPR